MLENPKRLPPDQDPSENDDDSKNSPPLNDQQRSIRKRLQFEKRGSVPDIMGKIRERDKSALAAEQWLVKNDPERRDPNVQTN